MTKHRIFAMSFAKLYPLYVDKAERKGRTKAQVDEIIAWLTGYEGETLRVVIAQGVNLADFIENAPQLTPDRALIKGAVCGGAWKRWTTV